MFDNVLKHRSGRVIALARAVLAAVFLFAIWIDPNQPAIDAAASYTVLAGYVLFAFALMAASWNNWWFDAKSAAPAHAIDIALFTLLVYATDGYTSPFFVFFVFLVLSAAIRWGWRQTAMTAIAVTILYFAAGLVAGSTTSQDFDLQRFIVRSGNLLILSALLIWFGVNHSFSALGVASDDVLADIPPDEDPLQSGVTGIAAAASATCALLLWRGARRLEPVAIAFRGGMTEVGMHPQPSRADIPAEPFLFDAARDRALARGPQRKLLFLSASQLVDGDTARRFGIGAGLGVPIRSDSGEGLLLLGGIESLCTDHIEFGSTLASAFAQHIQRHTLLTAVEDSAAARERLSLARDLHDSIVQFLAGATFRVEAVTRAIRSGDRPDRELADLKQLMLEEQQELRSAIGALRSSRIPLPRLGSDLQALCERLARQWDIACTFTADVPAITVPMRLHLDAHQLVREAVANAVRHGGASTVRVVMSVEELDLRLDVSNDGTGNARLRKGSPWSLRERVDEANGTLMLATRDDGTSVSITLPLKPEQRP